MSHHPDPDTDSNTSPKPQQSEKRDLGSVPIWHFFLPFLVVFLALGAGQQESWAGDSALYAKELPQDAAFARIVYFASPEQPTLKITLGKQNLILGGNQVTPFVVLPPGDNTMKIAGRKYVFTLQSGERLSTAFTHNTNDAQHQILGSIRTPDAALRPQRNKARLHLFNFQSRANASLKTGNGRVEIIQPVKPGKHHFRAVNPIRVALRVASGSIAMDEITEQQLEARRDYSFFIHNGSPQPQVIFVKDDIARN